MSKQTKIVLLSAGLVAIFVISFINLYRSVHIEQNILDLTHQIHTIRTENILINEQISNDFKRQNYDRLNVLMKQLSHNWNTLNKQIRKNFTDQHEIIVHLAAIDKALSDEQQAYLHYESDKAVLANSLFFLVELESNINKKDDPVMFQYSELLNTILKNVIYYNVGFNEIKGNISDTVAFLKKHNSNPKIQTKIVTKHLEVFYAKSFNIYQIIDKIQKEQISQKLDTLEKLFLESVDYERNTRTFINILVALVSLLMLLGFLITFFKTFKDKEQILQLQKENEQKNFEIMEKMQLLNEYKKALDSSSIVSKTDLRGIITYVNDKFCDISGYTLEELIGKPHNTIRHEDMPKEVFKELWNTIQNKQIFHAIIKNKKKNGQCYYVDSTVMPILDIHGNIIEYFAVRYDVTDVIQAKEEALAAEKAKSAFLATMSHELRTPLNAVIGFSQILLSKDNIPEATLKDFLDKINVAGKHLLNIVNNILDFSKIESQKIELKKQYLNISVLIDNAITLVETSANAKQIALKKENFDSIEIFADEQLLKQVVLNILSNAIKFTPEGKNINISYTQRLNAHCISICDEGIGLTKEQIKQLFKPFSQIEEHQNSSIKGTGLGLAISKKIMQLHNGDITVESEVTKGSCFKIFLPIEKEIK